MAVGGWWVDTFGARNVMDGEFETNRYFTVVLGVPIWLSYRGSFHFVEPEAAREPARDRKLHEFQARYAACLSFPQPEVDLAGNRISSGTLFLIPLRRRPVFGWMALFYFIVFALGIGAIAALISPIRLANRDLPITQKDINFFIGAWTCFALFLVAFPLFRWARRPSTRQRRIRLIVRDRLGPATDPAGWQSPLAQSVLADLGVTTVDPAAALRAAEDMCSRGETVSALVSARAILATLERGDATIAEEANRLTDDCLRRLEKHGPQTLTHEDVT